jgi:hypothetical protein
MSEQVMISKMSVKGLGCKPAGFDAKSEDARLCIIGGKATGIKMGEDNTGRLWSAITGSFLGINIKTGEEFRSGKLFLPGGIHEAVESAVKGLPDSGGTVKFVMEIRSVEAKNPIGYSYQAVNLMPMESETDELEDIKGIVSGRTTPKLEAPQTIKAKK